MKAEIKALHSPDVHDLRTFKPTKRDNFGFLLQLIVGPQGEMGEESFDMIVCTPKWLEENYSINEVIFGRHYLIVFKYDYEGIYKKISNYIGKIEEPTWNEVAQKIGRIGHWEFEDYKDEYE